MKIKEWIQSFYTRLPAMALSKLRPIDKAMAGSLVYLWIVPTSIGL